MPETTRITVGKNDEAAVVAEQLIDAETDAIIFVIPRGAAFSQSMNNFKLLKREGDVLGKEIVIESEDPLAQERAVKAGLEIGESASAQSTDEDPGSGSRGRLPRGRSLRVKVTADDEEAVSRISRVKKKEVAKPAKEVEEESDDFVGSGKISEEEEEYVRRAKNKQGRGEPVFKLRKKTDPMRLGRFIKISLGVLVIVVLVYVGLVVLPRASVTVEIEKKAWETSLDLVVDKSLAAIDPTSGKVPGQLFTQKSSVTVKLPATGNRFVEEKAGGLLTVYNAYSSQPQSIVASTRFVTPDGEVFRITKPLVIPGAKIENGTIIPSSVTATVVADLAGTKGNVGPTAHLSIPGFAKTPKYNGFYGELKDGASGGFSGQTKVATEIDIKAGKAEGAKQAEELVRGSIANQIPSGFKAIDGASNLLITKQNISPIADNEGMFTVVTEAQLSVFALREQDVADLLAERYKIEPQNQNYKIDSSDLAYGTITGGSTAVTTGKIAIPITYKAELSYAVETDALAASIAGQRETNLQTIIFNTPGISGGMVNLWPFYVRNVPKNIDKIEIIIE